MLSFSRRLSKSCCLLTEFRYFFFLLWVHHFHLFCLHLITTQFSLVMLSQISATCLESWYQKLEFCVTFFWFYYHRLWWSSWHAMLASFLIYIYIFLVWIFNGCDLFQVTVTDAYIVCSYFKTFEEITLYSTYLHCLLHCWHHLMLFCFTHVFIGFWLSFIIQFISTFNLSCTDHAKLGQWSWHFVDACRVRFNILKKICEFSLGKQPLNWP